MTRILTAPAAVSARAATACRPQTVGALMLGAALTLLPHGGHAQTPPPAPVAAPASAAQPAAAAKPMPAAESDARTVGANDPALAGAPRPPAEAAAPGAAPTPQPAAGMAPAAAQPAGPTGVVSASPAASAGKPAGTMRSITAPVQDGAGADVGSVTATETASGALQVTLDLHGLPPGQHAVHIHEVGKCDAPKFEGAKGHLAAGKEHGAQAPGGMHPGDLPNVTVAADGSVKADIFTREATIDEIMDQDGSAFVVHGKADDYMTQPSGNAGDRIACGVFAE